MTLRRTVDLRELLAVVRSLAPAPAKKWVKKTRRQKTQDNQDNFVNFLGTPRMIITYAHSPLPSPSDASWECSTSPPPPLWAGSPAPPTHQLSHKVLLSTALNQLLG